jgi:hypothetical protein
MDPTMLTVTTVPPTGQCVQDSCPVKQHILSLVLANGLPLIAQTMQKLTFFTAMARLLQELWSLSAESS